MFLEVRQETECPFLIATVILGFLSIFNKSHGSSTFEALNSAYFLRCQRDVQVPVQMRRETRAFSRVSTGDSNIPSSCEMNNETAFKPLQGNPASFLVRASQCPLHLREQYQCPSHIPIADGSLLLRYLWKVDIPPQLKLGNQGSFQDDVGCKGLYSYYCAEISVPLYLRQNFQGISGVA